MKQDDPGSTKPAAQTDCKLGSMPPQLPCCGSTAAPWAGRGEAAEGADDNSGHSMTSSAAGTGASSGVAEGSGAAGPRLPEEVRAAQDPEAERRAAGLRLLLASVGSSMDGCPRS